MEDEDDDACYASGEDSDSGNYSDEAGTPNQPPSHSDYDSEDS